ncbi:MAG: hypothetical protein M5U08_16925 [Burkholderiales bacterium]|nr:hypothetical protein [Burkholderiales bacterium]
MNRTIAALVTAASIAAPFAATGARAADLATPMQVAMMAPAHEVHPHAYGLRRAALAPEQIVTPYSGVAQAMRPSFAPLPGFAQMLADPAAEKLKAQRAASWREVLRHSIDVRDPRLQGWVNILAAN